MLFILKNQDQVLNPQLKPVSLGCLDKIAIALVKNALEKRLMIHSIIGGGGLINYIS